MKELGKAVEIRHGFEADEVEEEPAKVESRSVSCPRCDNSLHELSLSTMTGSKNFLVCKTCAYRTVV